MPPHMQKITNRGDKWFKFLEEDDLGNRIRDCILAKNSGWKTTRMIADQLSGAYAQASNPLHATSHEIAENKATAIFIPVSVAMQIFNAINCIGTELNLTIVRGNLNP